MATSVQEKVILNSSDATAPAPASQAIPVLTPFIPVEAPSLEGRAQSLDDMKFEITKSDFEEDGSERLERFKGVSPEDLKALIDWIRANPELTRESSIEDEFVLVESSTTPLEQSTETDKKSPPTLMSRVKQSFWSAVSSFYSAKK